MADLHDDGPGAVPAPQRPRRRRSGISTDRDAARPRRPDPGIADASGGIPRPSRRAVTTVAEPTGSGNGDDPTVPGWVNEHSRPAAVVLGTGGTRGAARVSARAEPEPLVIVPAVVPDGETDRSGEAGEIAQPTTGGGTTPPGVPTEAAPRPAAPRRQLQLPRRARVRRVTRVIRYVDPWGVFKIALMFNLVGYATTMLSGVLLWNVAHATGTVDNVERFMESFGWETFEFNGGEIFHAAWIIGLFAVVGLTGLAVLAAATFNLVTDLVGGIRVTVLEEELVAIPARRWLRPAPQRVEPVTSATAVVADGGDEVVPSTAAVAAAIVPAADFGSEAPDAVDDPGVDPWIVSAAEDG